MYFDRQTVMTSANARETRFREARFILICMRLATSDIKVAGEHNTGDSPDWSIRRRERERVKSAGASTTFRPLNPTGATPTIVANADAECVEEIGRHERHVPHRRSRRIANKHRSATNRRHRKRRRAAGTGGQYVSRSRPGTRLKCVAFRVTSGIPCTTAVAAIQRSLVPISWPLSFR